MSEGAERQRAEVDHAPVVRVLADAEEVAAAVLDELARTLALQPKPLVSFATGGTFAPFFAALARQVELGELSLRGLVATHLDEYLGFAEDQAGGMVHELLTVCPPLAELAEEGRFWAVPSSGHVEELRAHEERLHRGGGVQLQLLGLGRNGHIAFNEPGTPFSRGWHRARLADSTREDARTRFDGTVPQEAVTAGLASIRQARRLILAATGSGKASPVATMLRGPVDIACPASSVRRHPRALVLLDREAAAEL